MGALREAEMINIAAELLALIDKGELAAGNFEHQQFTDRMCRKHEAYSLKPDGEECGREILIMKDPLFYGLNVFESGIFPALSLIDTEGNDIKRLFERIKEMKEKI
jgi:hypothetical protein